MSLQNKFKGNFIISCLQIASASWQNFVWGRIRREDQNQIRRSKDLTFSCFYGAEFTTGFVCSRLHHPLQETREPLGWCQSKDSKCQHLRPVSGFVHRPRQSCQRSPAANTFSHPVERPSHRPPGMMLHLNPLAVNHLPSAGRLKHCI